MHHRHLTSVSSSARLRSLAVAGALLATPAVAHAQTRGFALDTFDPSERGSEWFANESLDLRGNLRPAVGLVLDYANRPLAIYNGDGSVRSAIVQDQLFVHAGASLVLVDRLRFALSLPILAHADGPGGTLGGVSYPPPGSSGVGDLRIGADVRLFGRFGDPFTLAAGVQLFVPTGSPADFAGDGIARVEPRVMAAGDSGIFAYALRVGFEYRGLTESYGGTTVGSELVYGVSLGVRLVHRTLVIGPELYGTAIVAAGSQVFQTPTTPLEGIVGLHYSVLRDWRVGAGGGAGLTRGYGAPVGRVLAVLEWAPAWRDRSPE
jgi:OmpA-OmpF porin, OOP family